MIFSAIAYQSQNLFYDLERPLMVGTKVMLTYRYQTIQEHGRDRIAFGVSYAGKSEIPVYFEARLSFTEMKVYAEIFLHNCRICHLINYTTFHSQSAT